MRKKQNKEIKYFFKKNAKTITNFTMKNLQT